MDFAKKLNTTDLNKITLFINCKDDGAKRKTVKCSEIVELRINSTLYR